MDPMSITGFALAATATVYSVSQTLAAFISKVGQVDENLSELHAELNFLHAEVNGIRTCLQHPSFIAASRSISDYSQQALLVQLQGLLEGCTSTLVHLGVIIHNFTQGESGNFAKKIKTQWRLGARTDEINVLRQRIQNYRSSMQLSLTTLQVYQQIQSPERGLDELYAKIDNLARVIEAKSAFFNNVKASLEAKEKQGFKVSDEDTKILGSFEDIRRSSINAKHVATVEADRRSTTAGTEQNFGGANASILGNPLSKDRLRELERWIPNPEVRGYDEGTTLASDLHVPERQQANVRGLFSASPLRNPVEPNEPFADYRAGMWGTQDTESGPKHLLYEKQSSLSLSTTIYEKKLAAGDLRISFEAFQYGMSSAIAVAEARKKDPKKPFQEEDFTTIRRLLLQVGKPSWSERPRTYLVLRLIDEISAIEGFVLEGLKDIHFPYTEERLPKCISSVGSRHAFLEKQKIVMSSKIADLVKGGPHRHLNKSADIHFTVLRMLGSGGHGTVDHVRNKLSLQEYARKRIYRSRTFAKSKKALEMFEKEVHNLKRLEHIHLVKLVGSYTDPKYVGLILEPVADIDLRRYLMRDPFPIKDLANLRCFFGCLSSAVKYLHEQKCRHKDIKPGNILIKDEKVLITDFGTALDWTELDADMTDGRPEAYTNTYAAPEVVQARPRNSSADVWSLGCVFLDMLTVLKGETLERKKAFFEHKGSHSTSLHDNRPALEEWLDVLEGQSSEDQEPISWIKQMTTPNPAARIDASTLHTVIFEIDDPQYYALCCDGDTTSVDGSWRGSDTDEDIEAVTERFTQSSALSSANSKLAANTADVLSFGDAGIAPLDRESEILKPSVLEHQEFSQEQPKDPLATLPEPQTIIRQNLALRTSTGSINPDSASIPPMTFVQWDPATALSQVSDASPKASEETPAPAIVAETASVLVTSGQGTSNLQQQAASLMTEGVNGQATSPQKIPGLASGPTRNEILESSSKNIMETNAPVIFEEPILLSTATSYSRPQVRLVHKEAVTKPEALPPPDPNQGPSTVLQNVTKVPRASAAPDSKLLTREASESLMATLPPRKQEVLFIPEEERADVCVNTTLPLGPEKPSMDSHSDPTQARPTLLENIDDLPAPLSIKKSVRSKQNPNLNISIATNNQVAESPAEPFLGRLAVEEPTLQLSRSASQRDSKALEPSTVHRAKSAATLTSTTPGDRPGLSYFPKLPILDLEEQQRGHPRPSVGPVETRLIKYFTEKSPRLEDLLLEVRLAGTVTLAAYLKDALEIIKKKYRWCYPLHVAIGFHSDALSEEVLEIIVRTKTVDINGVDLHYSSPLQYAIGLGRLSLVECLLDYGADSKRVNSSLQTPLHIAVEKRYPKIVSFLLRRPNTVEIEAKDNQGRTPLHLSCKGGLDKITSTLLEYGADIHTRDNDGNTPQMLAEAGEFHEIVALIVATLESKMFPMGGMSTINGKGSPDEHPPSVGPSQNPSLKLPSLRTPYYSCRCDLCKLLEQTWREGDGSLDEGTRCICSRCLEELASRSSIDFAVLKSSMETCDCRTCSVVQSKPEHIEKKLEEEAIPLRTGNSTRSRNVEPIPLAKMIGYLGDAHYEELSKSRTPKSCSCEECMLERSDQIVKAIEEAGFEGKLSYRTNPDKALSWAMSRMADLPLAHGVIKLLLVCGADIEMTDEAGRTPLHLAVSQGNVTMTQLLLERVADINFRRKDSFTQGDDWPPLHYAVVSELHIIVYLLLKHGETTINYQPESTRRTVVHHAISTEKHEMLSLLLQHSPDLELKDADSTTALHLAILRRSCTAAEFLLKAGANIEATESSGYKPLALAIEGKNREMVELLIDHGANVRCECGPTLCALMFAVLVGDAGILKHLLNTPAIYDINKRDATGRTVLHMLAAGWPDVVETMGAMLITNGANVNAADENGDTPLHTAANVENYNAIKFLISMGADLHKRNSAGISSRGVAEQKKDKNMVKNMGGKPKKRWMFA